MLYSCSCNSVADFKNLTKPACQSTDGTASTIDGTTVCAARIRLQSGSLQNSKSVYDINRCDDTDDLHYQIILK